ncbi:hypothetical protein DFP72DRAFT_1076556 [Ephemerocybe angulata]|uniref:F-box domain-containing protein n=1 Tax=Ephemerocybe angulata TaxID=980116 RepID=A0A8H6LXA6_9AGAR|nr:hypothetical protein DFP72DRAFT_1076556 [Tulosesus angulatus]
MFSSINRLPPEILGMVFEFFLDSSNLKKALRARISARECIMAVCCHWRDVALSHPPLWSRLSFCSPNYTSTMLARSKGAPLDVEFNDMRNGYFTKVLCRALGYPCRLRSVILSRSDEKKPRRHPKSPPLASRSVLGAALSKLCEPLPLLETLRIACTTGPLGDRLGFSDWRPTGLDDREELPLDFLTGGAPKLRCLSLEGCLFRWSNVPPSSVLTHLRLNALPAAEYKRPTAEEFFRSLAQMPLLEDVYLESVLPLPYDSSTPARPPVELSNLSYLHLEDSLAPVIVFFGGVRIPKRPNIELDCWNEPNAEELGQLLGNMAQSWNEGSGPRVRCIRMEESSLHLESVREHKEQKDDKRSMEWGTQGKAYNLYTNETPSGTFSRIWSINISFGGGEVVGDHINTFTQSLSTHFNLTHLKSLQVESDRGCSRFLFQSAFGHLPNLTTITFMGGSPRTHVFGLLPIHATDEQSTPPAHPAILFPALDSLVLEAIVFGKGTHSDVELLIRKLQQRLRVGPLCKLEITECRHIWEKDVARLKSALPGVQVEWDYLESDSESEDSESDTDSESDSDSESD